MSRPALTIIGERINSSRKSIAEAIENRDEALIRQEAKMQQQAGATYLDVNAGTFPGKEAKILPWLVKAAQTGADIPLSLDSTDPMALKAALQAHRGRPIVNSIPLEKARIDALLPLIQSHSCGVIAQTLESRQIPTRAEDRIDIAIRLFDLLTKAGVKAEDIYIDPVIQPVSMAGDAGTETLKALSEIRARLPGAHILCGVGNVSFQLPGRSLLDRTFLAMAMAAGADTAIIDPCNNDIMASVTAAEALLGRDEFCMRYITAYREEKLGKSG